MGAGGLGWSRRYPQAAAAAECVRDVAVVRRCRHHIRVEPGVTLFL